MPAITGRDTTANARTRLNRELTKHLIADFAAHGAEVIARMRKEKPVDYIKMVNAVLQKGDEDTDAMAGAIRVIERRIVRDVDPNRYAPWRNNPDFQMPPAKLPADAAARSA